MAGLFQALEVGKRALLTHQISLQTIGHNIANVNTPGYTRQRVNISTAFPEQSTLGNIGRGVDVDNIRHIRDLFLGKQYRDDNKALGQWTYREKVLTQVESQFGEPNDNKLSDLLNSFWDEWSNLSTTNNESSRLTLLQQTNLLVNGFHEAADQLTELRAAIDNDLVAMTEEVNRYAAEIARINQQIKEVEVGGDMANDLRDSRDVLIDELSNIVDINTVEKNHGEVIVFIGAMALVDGPDAIRLTTETRNVDGNKQSQLKWAATGQTIKNIDGQIAGLLTARDETIPDYMAELDKLAAAVIDHVNSIHSTGHGLDGTTGNNFFSTRFKTAANIEINSDITREPLKIAAGLTAEEGDNRIALQISELRETGVLNNGTTSINEYYNSIVGKLAVQAREARSFTDNYSTLLNQTENARQSVQGVSLDEEMTNMVKYQHAYDAAARVITAMDQALDTVIYGVGIVGR